MCSIFCQGNLTSPVLRCLRRSYFNVIVTAPLPNHLALSIYFKLLASWDGAKNIFAVNSGRSTFVKLMIEANPDSFDFYEG